MFLSLLMASTIAFADAPGPTTASAPTVQKLSEDQWRELMRREAELASTRKAVTKARAAAVATGDTATVDKSDAILTRLDDIQRKLDGVVRIEQLDGISGELAALTAAIDALPTSDEVRQIVREEIEAARPRCDGNMPGDSGECTHSDDEDEEDEDDGASDRDADSDASNLGRVGWLVGGGGSVDVRDDYGNVVAPASVGGHLLGGLTWEDGYGFGTGLLLRGGVATIESTMLGATLVAYHDGRADCGAGIGIELQSYDILGEGVAAANSVNGALSGYLRLGDSASVILEPYLRVGYFYAGGGVDSADLGVGGRLSVAFGSP